jgi:WD40 repeat protein
MSADPRRVKDLFVAALDLADPHNRDAFVARECGADNDLRHRLDALLRAHDLSASALDRPLGVPTTSATAQYQPEHPVDAVGSLVAGRYKLLQEIGEGGMGTVFMAEQAEPVRRKVALKIIKPGMDSKQVVARFEVERQALSMMDHPNIAKVLDAGTTATGRPYFVMELVHGVPVTEFCDANKLSPRERLVLFVPVCQAIQHAHTKGIIHRDVKPSNVLVTMYDDKPVPKVIDFGVAKAVEQRLTEKTLFTQYGALVGTFEYMSPEQAEMNALGVDTRSDVYSLGVLLYELLTGSTPLERQRLRTAALGEVVRLIREEEPLRPSLRLSTGGTLAKVAAARRTDPGKLSALVRGELDWIVMRCLEKDRTRRYETANALARDVQRHLAGDAVEACPPTLYYRLRKAYRKNRSAVLIGAAFAAVLLAATVVGLAFGVAATRAEVVAERDRNDADSARIEAVEQRNNAEVARREALDQRDAALRLSERMRRTSYVADMGLAWAALDTAKPSYIHELLDRHRPRPDQTDLRGFEWHLVRDATHSESRTFPGHRYGLLMVAVSPKGDLLATLSTSTFQKREDKGELKVWEFASGRERYSHDVDWDFGREIAFSPDGAFLAVTGVRSQPSHETFGELIVLHAPTGEAIPAAGRKGRDTMFQTPAFSPDGRRLAYVVLPQGSPSQDSRLQVIAVPAGDGLSDTVIPAPRAVGSAITPGFTPDGRVFCAWGEDGVSLWDLESGRVTGLPDGRGSGEHTWQPTIACRGTRLVARTGHTFRVWDIESTPQRLVASQRLDLGGMSREDLSPDGKLLAVADPWVPFVRVWDIATGRLVRTLCGHEESVRAVAFTPDGSGLVTASRDRSAKVWDLGPRPEVDPVRVSEGADGIAFRPDGGLSVVVGHGRYAQPGWRAVVLDVGSKKDLFTLPDRPPEPSGTTLFPRITFSADGAYVGASEWEQKGRILVWDVRTGRKVPTLPADGVPGEIGRCLRGGRLAVDGRDHAVEVWDLATGKSAGRFVGHTGTVLGAAFSPDGTRFVTVSFDRTARVWKSATGQELQVLRDHAAAIEYVAFSPDGALLATADRGGLVILRDAHTLAEIHRLTGHPTAVRVLAFSPDGRRLFTGSWDKTVKVWDTGTGLEILTLRHGGPLNVMSLSPDGHRLATITDGPAEVRIWDATPRPDEK